MARTLGRRKRRGSAKAIANGNEASIAALVREGAPNSSRSAEPPRPHRALQGCIEEASRTLIKGWVWDPEMPGHPIRLELTDGEVSVATAIANEKRPGLSLAGIGDGRHGFTIELEEEFLAKDRHLLQLRCADTRAAVPGSPITLTFPRPKPQNEPTTTEPTSSEVASVALKRAHATASGEASRLERAEDGGSADARFPSNGHVQHCPGAVGEKPVKLPEGMQGFFDGISGRTASGWSVDPDDPDRPAILDVLIDEEVVAEVVADRFRDDLYDQGLRGGYAHFQYRIPIRYFNGCIHSISFRSRSEPAIALANTPQSFCFQSSKVPGFGERADWALRELLLASTPRSKVFLERIREKRKVAIISTYHTLSYFLAYHRALARALSEAGFVVQIVHAADVWATSLLEIDHHDTFLFAKKNVGYDFGSWAIGFYLLQEVYDQIDELVFLNDSVIGPTRDLDDVFQAMRASGADLAGLTDSYEREYHLQSYFIWLNRKSVQSPALATFFANYGFESDKDTVIEEGELTLTRLLLEQGLTAHALYPYEQVAALWLSRVPHLVHLIESLPGIEPAPTTDSSSYMPYKLRLLQALDRITESVVSGAPVNPTHFFWDVLVDDLKYPFVKRELVTKNPAAVPSYFRLSDVLEGLPRELTENLIQVQQLYGGPRTPFINKAVPPGFAPAVESRVRRTVDPGPAAPKKGNGRSSTVLELAQLPTRGRLKHQGVSASK